MPPLNNTVEKVYVTASSVVVTSAQERIAPDVQIQARFRGIWQLGGGTLSIMIVRGNHPQ